VIIDLDAGETVKCDFTNEKDATIEITKDVNPEPDATDFSFTGLGGFSLDDDADPALSNTTSALERDPNSYTVTEDGETGYDLINIVCSGDADVVIDDGPGGNAANGTYEAGDNQVIIDLDAGETVKCDFTNEKDAFIRIVKDFVGNPTTTVDLRIGADVIKTVTTDGMTDLIEKNPATYSVNEAFPLNDGANFSSSRSCTKNGSAYIESAAGTSVSVTLAAGDTIVCTFVNTRMLHPGTIGFWRNWSNHYDSTQIQMLIDWVKAENPTIYNPNLTIAKLNEIFNFGKQVPRGQMTLAQLTGLKLDLAITDLQGTGGLVQKNDDICLDAIVDVSGIAGATAFFGESSPTVGEVIAKVEAGWKPPADDLSKNKNFWTFGNYTNGQLAGIVIPVLTGINEGTLLISPGC
jgi:Prealbumin-like fold domain